MSSRQVVEAYHNHGFKVKHIHGDWQFEIVKKILADTDLNFNMTGKNEHVPANVSSEQ